MPRRALDIADEEDEFEDEPPSWRMRAQSWMLHHPKDAVALLTATVGAGAIAINALWLQSGPHPAPLFALRPVAAPPLPHRAETTGHVPRPRPASLQVVEAAPAHARTRAELVGEIQKELARRGYYNGAVDGVYGPKTDAAVRDFAQAAQFKAGGEPSEAMLQQIVQSPLKVVREAPAASMPSRADPIGELIGGARPKPGETIGRIVAVQRALTDFGYGQIKPTGVLDAQTAVAIEKFERSRQMPVTGKMSNDLVRELAAVTGRPLE